MKIKNLIDFFSPKICIIGLIMSIVIILSLINSIKITNEFLNVPPSQRTFDVLVPRICEKWINTSLINAGLKNGSDFTYLKNSDYPEAYSNISGFIRLIPNGNNSFNSLLNIRKMLQKKCYADTSIGYQIDKAGVIGFLKEIEMLNEKGINIHSIRIDSNFIKIYVNDEEYKDKKYWQNNKHNKTQ